MTTEQTTLTITDFLLERIAEDEAWVRDDDGSPALGVIIGGNIVDLPARVLAECEAKQRIVELHGDDAPICAWTHDSMTTHADEPPCATLRALAAVYADHPDYNEAWA